MAVVSSIIEIRPERARPPAVDVASYLRPGTLTLPVLPPLSLYVHYPWCVRKCPYCDFNSHEADTAGSRENEYLHALRADLEAALPLIWGRRIVSIFIGGGTPSLMSARAVDLLLSDIRALVPLVPDCEITLEANPGTFEAERFASYRASGVNRLSIGIQSFDEEKLKALGRIHDRAQALAAIEIAQRHFDNFNLDLMYALPRQTLDDLQADVEQAIAARPPHLSLYQLTLEPNTVFAKYPPPLPDSDYAGEMHDWLEHRTAAAGYIRYEVSALAQAGRECRHNLNYWSFGDYLGIGAGAHSKISFPHRVVRQVRFRQPTSYLEHAGRGEFVAEGHEVSRADLPFEFMLNALRLADGVPANSFAERTGLSLASVEAELNEAERRGLLIRNHLSLRATPLGLRFLTDLQALFLPAECTK
ncbi:MAG: oxygen-independent coproporphyrinogen III oxidase-like protein [Burkholderiaceae bacterium]|nr:oxygen-independent coproporphyrinogen III oxidase-like protein [Burkholderiaceae bacterium]